MSQLIEQHLTDSRGKNTQFPLADLLRQSVYSRLAGYEDVNDAERVSADPTFRLIGSEKIWDRGGGLDFSSAVVRDGAESHLTRRLFGAMVRRMAGPPLPAG